MGDFNMTTKIQKTVLILVALTMLSVNPAWAVRPFITDDATLIGKRRAEVANWFYANRDAVEVWHSLNYGVTDWFEINLLVQHGILHSDVADKWRYAWTAPLLQTKFLLRDYELNSIIPGITFAIGSDLPFGNEPFRRYGDTETAFKAPGHGAFAFFSTTHSIGMEEQVMIHTSLGWTWLHNRDEAVAAGEPRNVHGLIWGVGTQFTTGLRNLYGIAELISGDPYMREASGIAYQLGLRYFVNDYFQWDIAFGQGLGGGEQLRDYAWISGGFRWVLNFDRNSNREFSKNNRRIR